MLVGASHLKKKKSLNEAFDALLEGDTYVEDLANNLLASSSLALEQEMMLQIILNATFFLSFFFCEALSL